MEKVPGADQQTRRAQAGSQPQGATERDARRRARGRKSKQFGVRLKLCQTNCLLFSGESGVWREHARAQPLSSLLPRILHKPYTGRALYCKKVSSIYTHPAERV